MLLLVLGITVPAIAGIDFQAISPDELKMTSEPKAPGAPAIILFRQVNMNDSVDFPYEDQYVRIKILTEEGRKYADIEIPYDRKIVSIVNLKARTIRNDGTIVNFTGSPFDKTIVKGKGIRYLAKTLALSDVQVGNIIEYSYSRIYGFSYFASIYKSIYDSRWIVSSELFTKKARFSLDPDISTPIRWSGRNMPPGTVEPKESGRLIQLDVTDLPAFQTEDYMPPVNELEARVDFIYSNEKVKDADKYWRKMAKLLNESLEIFVSNHKALEQAVEQIVSPSDSQETKLQKIYARVQQIRNISYEVEKTEQQEKREKQKDAERAESVWKSGYGDEYDLSWLFLGLVRAAGFEAYGVWTSDRSEYFFSPDSMQINKLSQNVVLVKLNGKDLYFDPGAPFVPYGLLPWTATGIPGLKLEKDGLTWVKTPLPDSSVSQIHRTGNLKLIPETGNLEGKLIVTYTGLEAVQRRFEERHQDAIERKKFLEKEVKEYITAASEVELTNKPDWDASSYSLVAEFDLKVQGWASAAGRRSLLPVGIFGAPEKHLFDHAERIHPIYFAFPSQKMDDITVELPDDWKIASVPQEQTADGHVISYTSKTTFDNNKLHLSRKLDINILLLEKNIYPVLRNLFMAVRTGDEQQAVLQPGAATAAN